MKNLLYFGNIPAPYTVKFLNELGKYLNIFALFERKNASDRDENWASENFSNFSGKILKSIKLKKEMGLSFGFLRYIKDPFDFILIGNPLTPTGILTIYYLHIKRIKFGIISEGGFAGKGWNLKERIKKSILSKASYYLSGSSPGHEYFMKYGASKKNLYEYPFSSMFKQEIFEKPTSIKTKEDLKIKFKQTNKKIILSVGQIIERKGFDLLIRIAKKLNNYQFIIVGGKANKSLLKLIKELEVINVSFVEHLSEDKIRHYFMMADLFVLLTRMDTYGLVINEAMSFGLPIVTSFHCAAGIHLIEDDKNGYLVDLKNLNYIQNKIDFILSNHEIMERMAINNIKKITDYSIEKMAMSVFQSLSSLNLNLKNL